MKKIKIKLNKRGKILLLVVLFSLSAVATVLLIGSIRSNHEQQATVQADITPEPTQAGALETEKFEDEQEEPVENITPTPIQTAEDFIVPKEGVRPIAVMIDNEGSKVLPQGGIGSAQVIYEMIVEYGATRYMAFFWDALPELVGPVRSARHYFLDYVMEYDAIYTHIGWSHYAYHDLEEFEIDNIDGVSDATNVFWDLTREADNYHDSYTSPKRISKYIESAGYSMETELPLPLAYHEQDTDLAVDATAKEVFIKYHTNSSAGFYYDADNKNYKRTRLGDFQIDRNTSEVIRAKNIIIQYVKSEAIAGDECGRQNVYTTGRGQGLYITNGKVIEITWNKNGREAQTVYRDDNGEKIILNPGQTWIEIVPLNAAVEIR